MSKGTMPIPVTSTDVVKCVDRIISAYERSCELEVEKEKIEAELKLGTRKIELEEKKLEARYNAAVKLLDLESEKLEVALKDVENRSIMTKAILDKSDALMKCIADRKNDDAIRTRMLETWMQLQTLVAGKLGDCSPAIKDLLASSSQNLSGSVSKMLSVNAEVQALE